MDTQSTPLNPGDFVLTKQRAGKEADRVRALAGSLDCLTEVDVSDLARIAPTTLEAWRKRGKGPPYVLFGNRFLYPREGLRKYLIEHQRERNALPASSLL